VTRATPFDQERETPAKSRVATESAERGWAWLEVDGSLALAPEPPRRRGDRDVGTEVGAAAASAGRTLKHGRESVSVPAMAWPEAQGLAARAALREEERARARRARRVAALALVAIVALAILLLTAFGTGGRPLAGATGPAPSQRLLPSGPPQPQIAAMRDTLRIQLPIAQGRVTAIGYHASGAGTLALEPLGTQANAGILGRLRDRLFGADASGLRYYLLSGGVGAETGGLDVGAPVGTDVYAPVDGTVIAISDQIVSGERYGVRMDIQPAGNPGLVVSLRNVSADPALAVGSTVAAGRTKVGRVIDLSAVERAALARYTQDEGQHVHLEVHTAASLATP